MYDDEIQCPYCGASGKFAWYGSDYENVSDVDFVENAYYICPKCDKDYSAHVTYKLVNIEIKKEEDEDKNDEER